jgi:integrase/recombinase XerD
MIRRLVRLHGERSEVRDRVTPHMFRHSVATYLLEEGVDIRYVQRLLGHRSISTTEIYTHVADAALKVRITERHPRRGIVAR